MKKALALVLSVLMVVSVAAFGSFSVAAETTMLIESGAAWDYYYVLGDEGALPEGWYEVGFDTTEWEVGATPFTGTAYANENANTQIDAQGQKLTAGFVTTFTVENLEAIEMLSMGLFYDENPVVYINGTEVFTTGNWNGGLTKFDLTDKIDTLVAGENTIAVYMENAVNGGGFHMDLTLEAGSPDIVDADGNVTIKSADKTGFANFGGVNAASNILDGDVVSCSGAGRDENVEQSWTVTFWGNVAVSEIYLQTKGKEDNAATTHEDGITYGYYNVYVGETLVGENVPAISEADGGYTLTLETPVAGTTVKVELVGAWLSTNWANLADIAIKGAVATEPEPPVEPPVEPEGPTAVVISPFGVGDQNGFENWPAEGTQTQLLICTDKNVPEGYTWVLTIVNDATGETKEVSLVCSSAYDTWLRRFEVCLGEGDNQFVPEQGASYTISAKIYDEAGELAMFADPATGFVCGEEPIVPAAPQPPVNPEPPAQTGDAAILATIVVAIAAMALVVVYKKRTNI